MATNDVQLWMEAARVVFNPHLYRCATTFERSCIFWRAIRDCDVPPGFERHHMATEFTTQMKLFETDTSAVILRTLIKGWTEVFRRMNSAEENGDGPSTGMTRMTPGIWKCLADIVIKLPSYLRSPVEHPVWQPPADYDGAPSWPPDDIERLAGLALPCVPGPGTVKHPDMLLYSLGQLHRLDPSLPHRLAQLACGQDHVYLSNASGTGKTRLLFELLAARWGLYFTCTADAVVDPYGSRDLSRAFDLIPLSRGPADEFAHIIPFSSVVPPEARPFVIQNRRLAHRSLRLAILARLMVFEQFCAVLGDIPLSDSGARMKWLLLQLRPQVYFDHDVFEVLALSLARLDDTVVTERITSLYAATKSRIEFVTIDETNIAFRVLSMAFSTADYSRIAPIFRELVACMASHHPESRLIITGTDLDMELAQDALQSSSSLFRSLRFFHSLGHFGSRERMSMYLRHFLGGQFPDTLCDMAQTWLRGRHRILAVFVAYTLQYGRNRAEQVLDTIIYRFTQYRRPGSSLVGHIYIGVGFSNERLEGSRVALRLRHATLDFMRYRTATTFTSDAPGLVSFGAALYSGDGSHAVFFEPLIYIGIARWLHGSEQYGILGIIRARLGDASFPIHPTSFAAGLAACLCGSITSCRPLRSFLTFSGPEPAFARKPMKLLLLRLSERSHSSRFEKCQVGSDACVQIASSPDDVLGWFDNASRPFLIPDADCGPDLMFAAELTRGRRVLVCVQIQASHASQTDREAPAFALYPEDFYKKLPEARSQFLSCLSNFSLPSTVSTRAEGIAQPFKPYSLLHLVGFAQPHPPKASYDTLVATIDFASLIQRPRPAEFSLDEAAASIAASFEAVAQPSDDDV